MPEDTQTVRFDPTNSFDVLQRLGTASDRLGQRGEEIGKGFIRGDRAVRVATQNITQGLLSANSAADAAVITFQSLERVFKIPLVATVGAAATIAGFAYFKTKVDESQKAYEQLREELQRPLSAEIDLSPEDLAVRIDAVRKATDAAAKSADSWAAAIGRVVLNPKLLAQLALMFQPIPVPAFLLPFKTPKTTQDLQKEATEGKARELKLSDALADNELRRASLKLIDNDLTKAELILEQKRAALVEESVTKGGNTLNLYKRFLAAQIDLEVAGRKKAKEDEKTLDAARKTTDELKKQAALLREPPKSPEQRKAEAIQEADQAVADAEANQHRIEAQQAEEARAAAQKKSDIGEIQRFGRVLNPQERLQTRLEDEGAATQKGFEDRAKDLNKSLNDQMEEQLRGVSPEQLKNEREFNKGRGKEDVSDLAGQDFSGIASLANQDFSGIASLGGLSIKIA